MTWMPPIPAFDVEKDVEHYYSFFICSELKCAFSGKFRTDGIYENEHIKLLAEYKVRGDLLDQNFLAACICQAMCYIRTIENCGERLPDAILIANDKHFTIFDSSMLENYLPYITNQMTASTLFASPPPILKGLICKNFNVHKYKLTDLRLLGNILKNYKGKSTGLKMTITNNNILRIFENFITSNILVSKLDDNEQVALFASIIFKECNNIEGKPNQIVTPLSNKKIIKINRDNYDAFLLSIKAINRPSSKNEIIAQADRLIKEVSRRFHGEFYTPKIWVDEAHKMIELQFGQNWEDEYVVWDPACGTGNLTRDYKFKELYCSTLFQSDIDIMNQRGYNNRSVKFQYDFLNDDVYPEGVDGLEEDRLKKLAPGLVKALEENKEIIIIFNPPYGQSSGYNYAKNTNTQIDKIKKVSVNDIYAKFLYRVIYFKNKYKLSNINIAIYSPATLFSSYGLRDFRKLFLKEFKYENSFMFSSVNFSDVSNPWPITFSLLSCGETTDKYNFKTIVYDKNIITQKIIYNLDERKNTLKEKITKIDSPKEVETILMRGPKKLFSGDYDISTVPRNSLGYATIAYNKDDALYVNIYNTIGSVTGGIFIFVENLYQILLAFMSQRSNLPSNFHEKVDEYINIDLIEIDSSFINDSIVYSLFNNRSYQFSFRSREINVENEWFWISNQQILQLADDNGFDELYQDTTVFNQERFVYQELQKVQLSPDAQAVLDKATELVIKSVGERKRLHQLHPEWHLNAWDVGWYQIKLILKDCMKDELAEFTALYKKFENRMREGVYKFGFLK